MLREGVWSVRERMILNFRFDELKDKNCHSLRKGGEGDAVSHGLKPRVEIWTHCIQGA